MLAPVELAAEGPCPGAERGRAMPLLRFVAAAAAAAAVTDSQAVGIFSHVCIRRVKVK